MKKISAFTLVELLIAASIFVVVMLSIYSSFGAGVLGYKDINENIKIHQAARQILERINLDLRNSFGYSEVDSKFIGTKEELSFLALADAYSSDKIIQRYSFVSYNLENNKLMRLLRPSQEALKSDSKIEPEEIGRDLEALNFSYAKITTPERTLEWKESWQGEDLKTLPAAVKVELTLKGKIPQKFERVIYIPLGINA